MSAKVVGMLEWNGKGDEDSHRDYMAKWLVKTDDPLDGPVTVAFAEGLPSVGSWWQYGNDNDPWAFCHPSWTFNAVLTAQPNTYWIVETPFSTRPIKRCGDNSFQNPLLEPARISGNFAAYAEEAFFDRNGNPIHSSSLEYFSGSEMEFDNTKMNLQIGMNFADSPVSFVAPMMQMLNDSYIWGVPPRCVKLSGARWQRLLYGTCNFFYTVDFELDIDFKTFDRTIADKGTRILKNWDFDTQDIDPDKPVPDPDNPTSFQVYKDINRENTWTFLNGAGYPATSIADVGRITVQKYEQGDLLLLGLPSVL